MDLTLRVGCRDVAFLKTFCFYAERIRIPVVTRAISHHVRLFIKP